MDSIWSNNFYKSSPALSWVFKVSFAEYFGGKETSFPLEYMDILSRAMVDIQVGKRESEYTSVYYGGLEFKKLTRAINTNNFTIKFNENKYFKVTEILEKIYNRNNMNQNYPESDGGDNDNKPYNTKIDLTDEVTYKIVVKMYDPNRVANDIPKHGEEINPMGRYEFFGCQLVSLDDFTLSYESNESITRSATFVYDYMKFTNYDDLNAETSKAEYEATKDAKQKAAVQQRHDRETAGGYNRGANTGGPGNSTGGAAAAAAAAAAARRAADGAATR